MRHVTALLIVFAAVLFSPQARADRQTALAAVIAEKTVVEAVWLPGDRLVASVLDNKGNRKGFAMYLCNLLYEHGVGADASVYIIDMRSVTGGGNYRVLGVADCNFPSRRR